MNAHTLARLVLVSLALLVGMSAARAEGTLTHMSGQVSVRKADGSLVPGRTGLRVLSGDTVVTGAGGFVRLEMSDSGEMVLRPDSQLKIESYAFVEAKPAEDNLVFSMLKGGLRTVTGLIGKRGNRSAYKLITETATIGIRGTQFDLRVCQANCGVLADGTYLAVRFGAVSTSNAQGTLPVAAGQVAFVPPRSPPVILPRDPGIGFTPPAVIPKLDEKKKLRAVASTADPAKPGARGSGSSSAEAPGKRGGAAASGSESSEGSGNADGSRKKADPDAKPGQKDAESGPGSSGGNPADKETTGGKPATPVGEQAAPQQSSASPQSGAGPDCSVQ